MKTNDLGFTFKVSQDTVLVFHRGRTAATLRGAKAQRFSRDVAAMDHGEQQQLMARLTGNYKHGNERSARNHPRNRR